jgi:hypothetical protein
MSYDSVPAALKTIYQSLTKPDLSPLLKTVERGDEQRLGPPSSVFPEADVTPLLRINRGKSRERGLGQTTRQRWTPYIVELWDFLNAEDPDTSTTAFANFSEFLQDVIRDNPQLGGLADTDSLRHSGDVTDARISGDHVAVQLTFGGTSHGYPHDPVEYAEWVHEGTDRMMARPYLAEPMEAHGPAVLVEVERNVLEDARALWRVR